ncbi:MAG TPA: long-chain fatty acid--CoA ligase [Chloroflexota bacterium]
MKVEGKAPGSEASIYDERPWIQHYAPGVAPSLDYPRQSIWGLLEDSVQRYGDSSAFVFQNFGMSFKQLHSHAYKMSAALAASGVKQGDVVFALLPNVPHFPVTYFGTLRLGAALTAASPTSVEREIENLLRDSGARTIVTVDILFEQLANVWERCGVETVIVGTVTDFMPLWARAMGRLTGKVPKPKEAIPYGGRVKRMRSFLASGRGDVPAATVKPEDVALLQYTGGTTGTPKAAMLTHGSLLANARQMVAWFPQLKRGEETLLAVLPFFHVYGVTLVMNAAMLLGANTILIPKPMSKEMFEAVPRYRPTIFPGVPTLYVAIVHDERSKQYDLSSIDVCVCGGAPLPVEVKHDFEELTGGHLYEGYGLSEASPVTHAQPHDGRSKPGSMGMPLADTDARIVDDDGDPVAVGESGELVIRGPQVMKGYWHRAEETADVLQDGWLRTGDIARMDEDGWFYIVDRKKDLIITGGENIYPREVEEVLFQHPAVKEVAVVGVPHPYGGEIAKAFVVLKPGEAATKKDITQFAAQRLSKQKVPRAVEFRSELPKSSSFKVLRRVLAEEERGRQAGRARKKSVAGTPDEET